MSSIDTSTVVIGISVLAGVMMLLMIFTVLSRFYRRCGADEALVRTGSGGNKVVIGGGVLVYPILHQLLRVSLRSVKLSVERSAKNALVTADKIKANVTTELYIKVEPIAEDVLAAARSFGERNLDEHVIADLIEGKLTDALRSVAANQTFMALHANRKQFAERIQEVLSEELKKNGLTLENVSITAFAMLPVKDLDPQDVFDAEGLRAITESVQTNREMTNRIQREKDNQIQAQNVTARKKQLEMEQDQKQAEADQGRKVAEYSAMQAAETARAVYIQEQARDLAALEKQRAVETGRIEQEKAVAVALAAKQRAEREALIEAEKGQQAAEIAKQRVIEAANIEKEKTVQTAEIERQKVIEAGTIDKEKTVEVARIGKQIAITQSEEQEARAAAAKALALAEEEKAKQAIITVETTAKAEREKAIQVIAAQAEAEVKRALADAQAAVAEKEAEATVLRANATAHQGEVEAGVRRKLLDAENAISARVVMRDILLKALEVAPEVTRELMSPAKAISEIKVLQTNGVGGAQGLSASGTSPALGAMSPVLKTILEAGAAYPLMRELMSFAQVDKNKLTDKARGAIGELTQELGVALEAHEPEPAPTTNRNGNTHVKRIDAE
jgi:flotillin